MRKRWIFLFFIVVLGVIGFYAVTKMNVVEPSSANVSNLTQIDEAYKLIRKESVHETSEDQLVAGAIQGMAGSLGDPYSTYYTKEEARMHKESLSDSRVGIGAEITANSGRFIIVSPVKSSPAEKAGLKPYDEIVQVNDERLEGKSMAQLLSLIQGEEGTTLKMTIFRPSEDRHIEVSLTRAAIAMETVHSEILQSDDQLLGYVSISLFGEKTAEEWQKHTSSLMKQKISGLIIDVRSNPGGYLRSVEQVIGSVVKQGSTYAFMQNSKGELKPLETVTNKEKLTFDEQLKRVPIVLLQDEGSASASEVLSGALKELNRATIAGVKSFGKGTVQETWPLLNGGELKLSTNKWLTPKKEWIHGKGIEATLNVKQDALYHMELPPLTGSFEEGDFNEQVLYVQEALSKMGYQLKRTDGYFDRETAEAVLMYRKKKKLAQEPIINESFFSALHKEMVEYKGNNQNDHQLQMAIGYMLKNIK
ncbi:S41 family peptidase [Viridibacillus sp. YIM B01967]|uniref:S41 family peptidase n=1 Tax=Viridibacillus soli TaxID=2798301 RepID=A0ABS1H772_9BACL|nr:S41 family peptidase [Viridibacillus soli]MBK3494868.1 S41 family peptidase [Viridibacillus soli]